MEEQLKVEKYFWANSLLTTSSTKSSELLCLLQQQLLLWQLRIDPCAALLVSACVSCCNASL